MAGLLVTNIKLILLSSSVLARELFIYYSVFLPSDSCSSSRDISTSIYMIATESSPQSPVTDSNSIYFTVLLLHDGRVAMNNPHSSLLRAPTTWFSSEAKAGSIAKVVSALSPLHLDNSCASSKPFHGLQGPHWCTSRCSGDTAPCKSELACYGAR